MTAACQKHINSVIRSCLLKRCLLRLWLWMLLLLLLLLLLPLLLTL